MRGFLQAARRGGLAVACVALLAACVPISIDPLPPSTSAPPPEVVDAAERSRELLDYTIELPDGWSDLTAEYLAATPDSVLAGYWTTAGDLTTDQPFATMSLQPLNPDVDLTAVSEEAAEGLSDSLADSVRGDSGYAETVDGGVISWASISGEAGGQRRTVHTAHIFYGPYYMYVMVETPEGDEASAHALLDSLSSVTITGPVDMGDRAGAPVPEDGRWNGYCDTLSAEVQQDWLYVFQARYDASLWSCPEAIDYLGGWVVANGDTTFGISVMRQVDMSLEERLIGLGTPEEVGEVGTSRDGYATELLAKATFVAPNGATGVRVDTATTAPGATEASIARLYAFEDELGGVTEVYVYDRQHNVIPDSEWLEPFIATIATP